MLKHGTTGINAIYKSNTKIGRVYKGTQLVYQGRRLPSEYVEVEYLESSGTQYIDTGFEPNSNTKIKTKFLLTEMPTDTFACAFGSGQKNSSDTNGMFLFLNYTVNVQARTGLRTNPNMISNDIVQTNYIYNVELSLNNFILNGITFTPSSLNVMNQTYYSLTLFTANDASLSNRKIKARFYETKIYDNNSLVRDFIPAVRLADGEAGLYDLVNDVFYVNAGTGKFSYGKFKNIPDGYAQVDLGTLTWTYAGSEGHRYFRANLNPLPKRAVGVNKANLFCSKYENTDGASVFNNLVDKTMAIPNDNDIAMVYDTSYTNATNFENGNSGVWLLYEKA